jgi:DNA-binding beta-propeller fold protein YncE
VSDVQNHRVQVFRPDGTFLRAFGSLGAEPGQFTIPFDLNVDAAGDVYVIDDGAERITKFDTTGSPVWTADHSTDPRLLGHAHTAAFDSAGRLVVAIDDTAIIARLDPETGRVIDTLPGGGCESAVDGWDRIYVIDCVTGAVRVLDERGQPLADDPTLQLVMLRRAGPDTMVAITRNDELLILGVTPP